MKSGFWKRVLTLTIVAVILSTDILPAAASSAAENAMAITGRIPGENLENAENAITGNENEPVAKQEPVKEGTKEEPEPTSEKSEVTSKETESKSEESDPTSKGTESIPEEPESTGKELDGKTVSDGDLIEIEEEEVPLEEMPFTMFEEVVNGVKVTLSGPVDAFAEGTTLSVVEVEPSEVILEKAEAETQEIVQRYRAFDINLVCNGEYVQPLNDRVVSVSFEGDMLLPGEEESVAVFHADETDEITDMAASVVENDDTKKEVAIDTTHFSTYVIVITGAAKEYTVTYRHFVEEDSVRTEFYKSSIQTIEQNSKITYTDLETAGKTVGGMDYSLKKVFVIQADEEPIIIDLTEGENIKEIKITDETVIQLEYEAVSRAEKYINQVVFYDYNVEKNISIPTTTMQDVIKYMNIAVGTEVSVNTNNRTIKYNMAYGWKGWEKCYYLEAQNWWYDSDIKLGSSPTLYNVTVNGKTYDKLEYRSGTEFFYSVKEEVPGPPESKRVSINDFAKVNPSGTYLHMGVSSNVVLNILKNGSSYNANDHVASRYQHNVNLAIMPNLVLGLSGSNYSEVVWGKNAGGEQITEPGYFTGNDILAEDNETYLKKVYDEEYQLEFKQVGNKYSLYSAQNIRTGQQTLAICESDVQFDAHNYKSGDVSGQFFPLNDAPTAESNGDGNNWYYGMRYDFTFKLGDYTGNLDYSFVGDDDLWVFVDGERVLDLGGIHKAYPYRYGETSSTDPNEVDLWATYFGVSKAEREQENWWEGLSTNSKYDPEHEYQVTVLYMERGGYASSAFMQFTLPNVETKSVTEEYNPLEFTKTDEETNEPLAGAGFTLFRDENCTNVLRYEVKSDSQGKVVFTNIPVGTYYMKETTTPEGYQPSEKIWTVEAVKETINDKNIITPTLYDGATVIREITNVPEEKTMDVTFIKVDKSQHSTVLRGAEFTLTAMDENGNQTVGEALQTVASNQDGSFTFSELEEGYYLIHETKAPDGYLTPSAEEGLVLFIHKNGTQLAYTVTPRNADRLSYIKENSQDLVENIRGKGAIVIKKTVDKVDEVHGEAVFTFRIEGPKGQVLYRTITFDGSIEDGASRSVRIDNLEMGEYVVTELSTVRYTAVSDTKVVKTLESPETEPEFSFTNEKTYEKNYSHSTVSVNKVVFQKDESGSIVAAVLSSEAMSSSDEKEQE